MFPKHCENIRSSKFLLRPAFVSSSSSICTKRPEAPLETSNITSNDLRTTEFSQTEICLLSDCALRFVSGWWGESQGAQPKLTWLCELDWNPVHKKTFCLILDELEKKESNKVVTTSVWQEEAGDLLDIKLPHHLINYLYINYRILNIYS